MQVSKNFTRQELECPCCHHYRIDENALRMLQEMRDVDGKPFKINSAYRCVAHNKAEGGKKNSQHLKGTAFDIHLDIRDADDFIELAKFVGFNGIGKYDTFIHVDLRKKTSRWGKK